jgi:hypothetical protein
MWAVLCWRHDQSALWAFDRLRRRGRLRPLELFLLDDLSSPRARWEQRLSGGSTTFRVELPNGRSLDSRIVRGVLNRAVSAPTAAPIVGHPEDRAYATAESAAFAASWLRSLGPRVVNPPRPNGLVGPFLHTLQWRALARRAGLDVVPFLADSSAPAVDDGLARSVTALAVGGRLLADAAPAGVRAGVATLSGLVDLPLMSVRFSGESDPAGPWRLVDAWPYPDLFLGGEAGIEALEDVMAA